MTLSANDWTSPIENDSRDRIRELQDRKVSQQAEWVYSNAPFWRRMFEAAELTPDVIEGVDDLSDAPFGTKADYRNAQTSDPPYGGLLCRTVEEIHAEGGFVWETSGSTGKPIRFLCSRRGDFETDVRAACRILWIAGVRPGDVIAMFWPLTLWAVGHGIMNAAKELGVTILPLGPSYSTDLRIRRIMEYRPSTIMTTPSYALKLADVMEEQDYDPETAGIERVIVSGEALSDATRTVLSDRWDVGTDVFDYYGLSEAFNCRSIECEEHDGIHVLEDLYLCQVVDPDGTEPVEEGELGELVVTALEQRDISTGFHYRTGDLARFTDEPCACGRTTRRIEIISRKDDMRTIRGVNVYPQSLESIVWENDSVANEFRLVISKNGALDHLTLVTEPVPDLSEAQYETVRGTLEGQLESSLGGLTIPVEFAEPGELERFSFKADRWVDRR